MVLLTTATMALSTEPLCHRKSLRASPRVLLSAAEKITQEKLLVTGSWHRWGLLPGHPTQLLKDQQHRPDSSWLTLQHPEPRVPSELAL